MIKYLQESWFKMFKFCMFSFRCFFRDRGGVGKLEVVQIQVLVVIGGEVVVKVKEFFVFGLNVEVVMFLQFLEVDVEVIVFESKLFIDILRCDFDSIGLKLYFFIVGMIGDEFFIFEVRIYLFKGFFFFQMFGMRFLEIQVFLGEIDEIFFFKLGYDFVSMEDKIEKWFFQFEGLFKLKVLSIDMLFQIFVVNVD